MDQLSYRDAILQYVREQAKPPDKLSHQARLYQLARQLAEGREFDDDVLYAAAWLHDLGVFIGHRPDDAGKLAGWDHLAYIIDKAPDLLRAMGFPTGKVEATVDAIRTHLPATKPATFEGVLLRDADILEQLGATGILRTVSKVGRDTRFVRFHDALRVLKQNLEALPGQLQLETAKRLAVPRMEILRRFLEAATSEAAGIEW